MLYLLRKSISSTAVSQNLRRTIIFPDAPLIGTTAWDEIDAQAISESISAVAVLDKPFSITAMVGSLTTVLNASPQDPMPIFRVV